MNIFQKNQEEVHKKRKKKTEVQKGSIYMKLYYLQGIYKTIYIIIF